MEFDIGDLTLVITAGASAIIGIIVAIQKSKCSRIECFCMKCIRDPTIGMNKPKKETEENNNVEVL